MFKSTPSVRAMNVIFHPVLLTLLLNLHSIGNFTMLASKSLGWSGTEHVCLMSNINQAQCQVLHHTVHCSDVMY